MSTSLLGKLIVKDGDSKMRVKKEINIQIGEQIKRAREKAMLTQEQFAERIDVSPQYVSDLERGVVGVSIATLKRVCTVLSVSSDQILFGFETENRAVAIAEKCESLSENQYMLLSDIVSKFVEAVESANSI
ncbi:MAG: helix-turn-helix transcriptional regulator [Clostridiales bacterium]|nr:helix-turn-helix transcriptional regulator [Clostridiales bacterium]